MTGESGKHTENLEQMGDKNELTSKSFERVSKLKNIFFFCFNTDGRKNKLKCLPFFFPNHPSLTFAGKDRSLSALLAVTCKY